MGKDINPKQQIADLIKKSKKILIITHVRPDGDAIASVLALKMILEKLDKDADAVIPDEIPQGFAGLPGLKGILKEARATRDLIISIMPSEGKVGKISYNKKDNGSLDLIISPSQGAIKQNDVSFALGGFIYDLIIVLDSPDLERVSDVYKINKDLFENVPIINIDHHSTNKNFGQINLVDNTATSTCEILVSLAEALDKNLIDEEIATLLLTGIITDTNRFQNPNTTPKSLTIAAQLIAAGARRSEIIKNIYKTHSISVLKLWGEVLSNIKEDKENKIVWSAISKEEIEKAGVEKAEVGEEVLNELLSTAPGAQIVLLFVERDRGLVTCSMRTSDENIHLDKIALLFGGGGHKQAAGFKIENTDLAEAERKVIEKIKEYLKRSKEMLDSQKLKSEEEEKVVNSKEKRILFEEEHNKDIVSQGKQAIRAPEELYSPSVSDINLDKPKIIDDKTSILQKVIKSKKEKAFRKTQNNGGLDFARMEEEFQRQQRRSDEEGIDEDYE